MSDCDGDGVVAYREFAKIVEEFINENFKFSDQIKKKELYELNKHEFDKSHPQADELDTMELFRTFKKYDRN